MCWTSPSLMSQTPCLHPSLQKWVTHIFSLCYSTVNTYTWFLPPRWETTSTQIPRHTQPWFPHQVLPSEITQHVYQMLLSHGISDISICCFQTIILMVSWANFNFQAFNPDLMPDKMWNIFIGSSWTYKRIGIWKLHSLFCPKWPKCWSQRRGIVALSRCFPLLNHVHWNTVTGRPSAAFNTKIITE